MTALPDRLRDLAETLVGDEWEHPIDAVETCRLAVDEIERLRAIIVAKLHLRRCHDCGLEFYAADGIVSYCVCERCGSQDTRMVRNKKDHDA